MRHNDFLADGLQIRLGDKGPAKAGSRVQSDYGGRLQNDYRGGVSGMIRGIDISHHQGSPDFKRIRAIVDDTAVLFANRHNYNHPIDFRGSI